MSVTFERIIRAQFLATPRALDGADRFANTFVAKADALRLWDEAMVGLLDQNGHVKSAMCTRLTKRGTIVANLQLLHTFAAHRRKGYASRLVRSEYERIARECWAQYFRVSSEHDAVGFYRSLGLKFWGLQKSGSYLCIHFIAGFTPGEGVYQMSDWLRGQLHSGRRGALVESFSEPR